MYVPKTELNIKMGVYKNFYNRRPVNLIQKWCLAIVCVFLLCSAMDCTIYLGDNNERIRHHHQHQHQKPDDFNSQLEKTLIEESSKRPILTCPNCLYKTDKRSQSDSIRLEAIKHQILMKLGLKDKPNVTHHLPKEVIMETLFRAEESGGFLGDAESQEDDPEMPTTSARSSNLDMQDFDDFYGRTSEIITFAEQGQILNDNRLLEFRMTREPEQAAGQDFRIRAATLWLRVDMRHHQRSRSRDRSSSMAGCVPTLWVFSVDPDLGEEITRLEAQDFSEMTELSAHQTVDLSVLGWQKFDITSTIRNWYTDSQGSKLRLLIDCSGCCKPLEVHTFGGSNSEREDPNRDPNRPFLVVHTDPNTTKRVRRRALDCSGAIRNQCCKQRFYVSFKELGWDDWVIAPSGYYANYCKGDCGNHRTPDTFLNYYTHVIEEIRKTQHLSGMQPCCAPLKFSSMSLIYFGPDSNIIKRDLPKMVVDECGCP